MKAGAGRVMSAPIVSEPICRDWQTCEAPLAESLVRDEIRAWLDHLAWDVAEPWSVLEPARRAGRLPGLVAHDADGAAGWTAYLPVNGHLQVMALVARSPRTTAALVDAIVESAGAHACQSIIVCVREAAAGLGDVLAARGFTVDPYRYLVTDLVDRRRDVSRFERWDDHADAMARLCHDAYREAPAVRAFAPGGTLSEWRQYVAMLVEGTGCGWFLPELSFVVPSAATAGLDACLMLSDLGTGAAHIAQVAVAPAARRQGIGRQLVSAAVAEASRFYDQLTLLVAASNGPAARLYQSLGFREHARFIVARR